MNRCEKCHGYVDGDSCRRCCTVGHCLRAQYLDGRCKRHADEYRYARMRELERACRAGTRVRCVANREFLGATALSGVRIVRRPGGTRYRWPSVLVRLDGHFETNEWPAIDVELAHGAESQVDIVELAEAYA